MSADPNDPTAEIERAVNKAEQQTIEADYAGALKTLMDALFKRFLSNRSSVFRPSIPDLVAIERLSDLVTLFGEFDSADALLDSIQDWYAASGNRYFSFYAKIKRIRLMLGSSKVDEAYQALRSLIPEIEQIDLTPKGLVVWEAEKFGADSILSDCTITDRALLIGCLYLEMGRSLACHGQYADALAVLARGQFIAANGVYSSTEPVILHMKLTAAGALLEKGDLPAARSALDRLSKLSGALYPGLTIDREALFSKLNLLTGELGSSLNRSIRVFEMCGDYQFNHAASIAALNLAHILIQINQTDKARDILSKIRERSLERKDDAMVARADSLLRIADARCRSLAESVAIASTVTQMRDPTVAKIEGEEQPSVNPLHLRAAADYLVFFEDRSLGFHWYLGNGDSKSAERYLGEIGEVFAPCDSQIIQTRLQLMRGMLYYYQGRYREAEAILNQERAILLKLGLRPELWQVQRFLGWCWKKLGRNQDELLKLTEETSELQDEMTDSLPPEHQVIYLLNKWTADEEYVGAEITKLTQIREAARCAPKLLRPFYHWRWMKRLCTLMAHIDLYKDRVATTAVLPVRGLLNKSRIWGIARQWLFHPADNCTIAFLVLPDRVLVISLGRRSLNFGVSSLTRVQVQKKVAKWHRLTDLGAASRNLTLGSQMLCDSRVEQRNKLTVWLAESLQLTPLLDELDDKIHSLTIVPDDSLLGFPFAAISYKGHYLIERFAISIGLTIAGRNVNRAQTVSEALVVAVPNSAQSAEFGWIPPLPGTVTEINHVQQLLTSRGANVSRLCSSDSAGSIVTKRFLLGELQRVGLAHIACHGIFKTDQPDQSGLIIVHGDQTEILSLRDLAELDLSHMQHVTLSACWLADSFVLPGRWAISLPEVLWRDGVGSIVGSLWPVTDSAAARLMARFYRYLADAPRDLALQRALRDCAQGALDESPECPVSDPFYWAGYYLYGNRNYCRISPSGLRLKLVNSAWALAVFLTSR